MTVEIQSILVVSLAHLSQATLDALSGDSGPLDQLTWSPQLTWDYGWFWYVDDNTVDSADFPAEFAAIFKLARSHGCDWVRFDEAGPQIATLPTFGQ